LTNDAARPDAVERRHEKGERTARENIEDLCDPGTFVSYGSLVVGQGLEGSVDELLGYSPGDGLVMGLGHVNGDLFDETHSRCIAMSYDYTVLAGTQGGQNHRMKDRIFNVAHKLRLPIVFFTEGGGGRAGGGSRSAGARGRGGAITGGGGLGVPSFTLLAMGGPAMIEGGGLGVFRPEEVGPLSVQVPNGVVDIAVADEAEAVRMAKKYLSYFQGRLSDWECADQRVLRHAIPENRLRIYDIRALLETVADTDSVLELRPEFGRAMLTAFVRIEGRPLGVVANNPAHLSGAIDSPAADKAARFMQLCDAFDIPLLFLCDTPGIMVGPEVEITAIVRHCTRMFVIGASITVPTFTVVLRKAYGL
ncbi:MAG: carboxyl transferase domain-containing protein, partial [Gammaproteobacteria bacterium]